MQESSWPENDARSELNLDISDLAQEELKSLTSNSKLSKVFAIPDIGDRVFDAETKAELPVAVSVPGTSSFPQNLYRGRRGKAAAVLTAIWAGTIALHLISWGAWVVWGLTGLLWMQALRVLFAEPKPALPPLADESREDWPYVSLLVAAKNEEAVIARFVESICNVDYPIDRYEVWAIDDHSSDATPIVLEQLTKKYPQLKIFRRGANASGGKSGALNQVLPLTRGEFVGIFDADATVTPDLLRRVLPVFQGEKVGAVQVRKAIANASVNFWTRGQEAEMALDSFFQQQRIAIGGIGELRGNGQFMRRTALESCGGWNEETITDDLDLTVRLHLDRWDIEFLAFPAVSEEGVTNARALWHQRNRWAEGGYQRYLDYWRLILRNRMGTGKTWDLFGFWVSQYFLPTVALPDFVMSIALRRMPIASPITFMTLTLSVVGMFVGLRRTRKETKFDLKRVFVTLLQTLRGTVYMFHWLLVGTVTARIAVRPKRLKWVKTVHQGAVNSIK
ncbi:glycosyl transferase family 2 [Oscillatoria nigro-viridis PCC 7112]|uniref:Beta-monoglucosyldiacylglycerol synthase n=1 Tax=Phormidium nigroviride PCC 7112 TaxID=179408 RepID=K9VLF8_9CYAN|nr:glycosyltransferase family 2 protein [Oscillatoria nigro-viridis]AFZ08030.1 glycosyl transferase family 2 [Oscillatoria nigro-viridis PCC 7112]